MAIINLVPDRQPSRSPPIPIHITHAAYLDMERFFAAHPAILSREQAETGTLPLQDPDGYFSQELHEPGHRDVRLMVELHDGVLGRGGIQRWSEEELHESEHRVTFRSDRRHEVSVCPSCYREFRATGKNPGGVCDACVRRSATWAAPPRTDYPGSPFYPGNAVGPAAVPVEEPGGIEGAIQKAVAEMSSLTGSGPVVDERRWRLLNQLKQLGMQRYQLIQQLERVHWALHNPSQRTFGASREELRREARALRIRLEGEEYVRSHPQYVSGSLSPGAAAVRIKRP